MLKLKIDNVEVNVPEGLSVMGAARLKGIDIPSMCYREGKPHFTSCMICMVKDQKNGKLFPSCSVKATEGMDIVTRDEEVEESRRMALELLLSEHVGDCEAPCQLTCPAHMDIPLMNRLLAEGKFDEALKVVKNDIALPAVFGRICPAPCEGACRRKTVDSAVSICLLKRYAGDQDSENKFPYLPEKATSTGKKIAIIGAGPAGLAAAHYLQIRGHQCDIYDRHEKPGGSLWREVESKKLEAQTLENEIALIAALNVRIHSDAPVDKTKFQTLEKEFDAILITCGSGKSGVETFGIQMTDKGIEAEKGTYTTSNPKVFAAGSVIRPSKLAIRTLGQGKEVAFSIDQFLKGEEVSGETFLFNSRFGKLMESEIVEYMKEAPEGERLEPEKRSDGFTKEQVMEEAERCMHCDCRAIDDCKLRTLSDEYKANQKHYWSEDRKLVQKHGFDKGNSSIQQKFVIYEPNKCMKCGICVHICEDQKEKYGMSFIGRGFDVVVGVPFGEALATGLAEVAEEVVKMCPTGALEHPTM
jgi:NADPH-dependent glutamate synthase beta subunit-like oxidoreductase/NAD-dependent dihydropyrimidine dehydrogenase PreA subunit